MKIELFFPLGWGIDYSPHLSLPTLTGYLRSNNIDVLQKDLNAEIINYMFSEQYTQILRFKIDKKIKNLNKSRNILLKEQIRNLNLSRKLLDFVPCRIKDSIDKLKKEGVKQAIIDNKQRNILFAQFSFILSSLYSPNKFVLQHIPFYAFYLPNHCIKPLPDTLSDFYKHSLEERNNFFMDIYQDFFNDKINRITKGRHIVGISVSRRSQIISSLVLARFIKGVNKDAFIVLGGATIPYMEESIMNFPQVFELIDCIISGEGEIPLLSLHKALEKGKDLKNVPQAIFIKSGKPIKNRISKVLEPDDFPLADYDGFNLSQYFTPVRRLNYLTSRGCYWNKCAFCSLTSSFGDYRQISMKKMAEDIKILKEKYNCSLFYFTDECISPKRIRDISQMLGRNKIIIKWAIEARPEKGFTKALLIQAYKQGCRLISWGVESFSNKVLKLINKGTTVSSIKNALSISHQAGIWNNFYIIFGFPGETVQDINRTIASVLKNKKFLDSLNATSIYIQKHSRLFTNPDEFEIVIKKAPDDYFGIYEFNYKSDSADKDYKKEVVQPHLIELHDKAKKNNLMPPCKWDDLLILLADDIKKNVKHYLKKTEGILVSNKGC